MVSELGGSQISTLLETLPGIANVLRSPVADALGNVIRAGARLSEFNVQDAEELLRYATRRGLLGQEEGDRLLAEVHAAEQRRRPRGRPRTGSTRQGPDQGQGQVGQGGQESEEAGQGQEALAGVGTQVLNSCINAVSRVAPWSNAPAAAAISSVLAVCSSAAAVTSSLAEACSPAL